MTPSRELPSFAQADWYHDPTDHRCPHDGWLESIEIREPADGARREKRRTVITIRLFGAYHDGYLVFRYSDVSRYRMGGDSCGRGVGDWLEDRWTITPGGSVRHEIQWQSGTHSPTAWFIEAREVSCEWIPLRNEAPAAIGSISDPNPP